MNIYVGNLAYSVTDADLKAAFAPYGQVVSAEVIIDKRTRRSRGYGFVKMASDAQGQAAISALNGRDLQGRALRVDESRPDNEKRSREGSRGKRPGGDRPRDAAASPQATAPAKPQPAPRRAGLLAFLKGIFSKA